MSHPTPFALQQRRAPAGRVLALAVLVAAVLVAAIVLAGGSGGQELHLRFENASQLVNGDQVKIGGVPIGTVEAIELADDGDADVKIKLDDDSEVPLRQGTRARIRISSLSSVANRFIAITPGPKDAPALPDGATIPTSRTTSQVEIDSVLSAFDAPTRAALRKLVAGGSTAFSDPERFNKTLHQLTPALSRTGAVARELDRDRAAFSRFLVQSAAAAGAVASRDADLDRGIVGAAGTAQALADRRADLSTILRQAPGALDELAATARQAGSTLRALTPTARRLRATAPGTAALVADAQPLLRDGPAALRSLDALLPPLRTALRRMPGLRDTALPAFTATIDAAKGTQPILDGLLPYLPDLFHGIVTHFGGAAVQSYDANGMYARIAPTFDTLGLTGGLGALTNVPPVGTQTGLTRRCPGAAFAPAGDRSNAVTPDPKTCDPDQRPTP